MSARAKLKRHIREEATRRPASDAQERQTAIRARLEKARAALASGTGLSDNAVVERHHGGNQVSARALSSHATDNALRAVGALHQKDNSTDGRVLAQHPSDNAQRAVGADHVKTNTIRSTFNASGDTISSHISADTVGRRELLSHATDDALRAVTGNHIRSEQIVGRHMKTGSVGNRILTNNLDGSKLADKSVGNKQIAGMHGAKIIGRASIAWEKIAITGVVFTPRLNQTRREIERWALRTFQKK